MSDLLGHDAPAPEGSRGDTAWLDRHAFPPVELALAMACVRPAAAGELGQPGTVIAVRGRGGFIRLYWAAVLARPEAFGRTNDRRPEDGESLVPRILGVVDLGKLATLDPSQIPNRQGFWRGGPGGKGPGEKTDPERDAARDRLKGWER